MTHTLVQTIGLAIVNGEYENQGRLPSQKVLCEQYGVSRIVVREAIKMLTAKQMVFTRMSRGTLIQPEGDWNLFDKDILAWLTKRRFSPTLLREFNETRNAVEPSLASTMARYGSEESIVKLEQSVNDIISSSNKDWDMLNAKTQFHMSILTASSNRFFYHFSWFIQTAIKYQHLFGTSSIERISFDPSLYHTVYQHISEKDSLGAANAMQELLKSTFDHNPIPLAD